METDMTKYIQRIREKHPDVVILFRCGDFYTMLKKDAHIAHSVLGLQVEPLVIIGGVSYEASSFRTCELDYFLPKLIRAGFRVAICDLPNV